MSEESELQAKISRLSGRIDHHKAHDGSPTFALPQHSPYAPETGSQWHAQPYSQRHHGYHPYGWARQEAAPYEYPPSRPGPIRAAPHRNRTLVLNSRPNEQPGGDTDNKIAVSANGAQGSANAHVSKGWVTKHDRHKQLINNAVYEQKTQERAKAIEQTQRKKQAAREEREKIKIARHLQASASSTSAHPSQASVAQLYIDDIRFLVADGGSKLIKASGDVPRFRFASSHVDRLLDDSNLARQTPKAANVGGVKFVRSKHGNLYRAGLVKIKRSDTRNNSRLCHNSSDPTNRNQPGHAKSAQLCQQFTSTGIPYPTPTPRSCLSMTMTGPRSSHWPGSRRDRTNIRRRYMSPRPPLPLYP